MDIRIGKTYKVNHTRKGEFNLLVTSANLDSEWVTGIIVEGSAIGLVRHNDKYEGEEITVRKSLATFTDLDTNT